MIIFAPRLVEHKVSLQVFLKFRQLCVLSLRGLCHLYQSVVLLECRPPQADMDESLEGLCSIAQFERHYGVFVQTEGCRNCGFRYVPRIDWYLVVSAHQVDDREYFLPGEQSRKVSMCGIRYRLGIVRAFSAR